MLETWLEKYLWDLSFLLSRSGWGNSGIFEGEGKQLCDCAVHLPGNSKWLDILAMSCQALDSQVFTPQHLWDPMYVLRDIKAWHKLH